MKKPVDTRIYKCRADIMARMSTEKSQFETRRATAQNKITEALTARDNARATHKAAVKKQEDDHKARMLALKEGCEEVELTHTKNIQLAETALCEAVDKHNDEMQKWQDLHDKLPAAAPVPVAVPTTPAPPKAGAQASSPATKSAPPVAKAAAPKAAMPMTPAAKTDEEVKLSASQAIARITKAAQALGWGLPAEYLDLIVDVFPKEGPNMTKRTRGQDEETEPTAWAMEQLRGGDPPSSGGTKTPSVQPQPEPDSANNGGEPQAGTDGLDQKEDWEKLSDKGNGEVDAAMEEENQEPPEEPDESRASNKRSKPSQA